MKEIYEYLKELFTQWYVYLAVLPEFFDFVSAYLPEEYHFQISTTYTIIFLVIVFIVANFRIWQKAFYKDQMPKIIVDYDLSVFNLIYLEVKNIGNAYARDIKIVFSPNIEDVTGTKINNRSFLKDASLLEPIAQNKDKKIRFLFGTFLDKKYLQKFDIKISYFDIEKKKQFQEKQTIDLSSFIGTSQNEKESDKIVKELKNISKQLKDSNGISKSVFEFLKKGIHLRNIDLINLSIDELKAVLKNLIKFGNKEDFRLSPYIYDMKLLIKTLRTRLLSTKEINERNKKIIEQLNILYKHEFYLGENKKFNEVVGQLEEDL